MRFVPIAGDNGGLIGVTIEHEDESVVFNMATRRSNVSAETMFDPCNLLIQNLSPENEERLFGAYLRARQLHTAKVEANETLDELRSIHATITDCISPFGVEVWATSTYGGFAVPQAISARKEGVYPPFSSYDYNDYCALCGLSTTLKLHAPIVFLFLDAIGAMVGKDKREYTLFTLIGEDALLETTAYTKLRNYTLGIATTAGEVKIPTGLVLEGICSEDDFARLILAPKLLRDLALSETDIPFIGDAVNNITAKITKAITTQLMTLKKTYEYTTKKSPTSRLDSYDSNSSGHEDTTVQQPYSSLYKIIYNRMANNEDLYISYGVDKDLYTSFKDVVDQNVDNITLSPLKLTILALTLTAIPAEAFTLIRPTGVLKLMRTAAAVLHTRGLFDLVSLLLATEAPFGTLTPSGHYIASEAKPNPDLLLRAQAMYDECEGGDVVTRGIDDIVKKALRTGWTQNTPNDLHSIYGVGRNFTPSREFKNELLKLLV
jgi:hypothetical protein